MGWTVQGSDASEVKIFHAVQTGPAVHQPSCTMGTGSFPGVQWLEHSADHASPSYARLQMGWRCTSPLLCACRGMSWGDLYPYCLGHKCFRWLSVFQKNLPILMWFWPCIIV